MRRISLLTLPALALVACGEPQNGPGDDVDAGTQPVVVKYCEGATTAAYDPLSKKITVFPDDFWTKDEDASATKKRVNLQPGLNVEVPPSLQQFASVYQDLSLLDGFGTTAALTVQVTGTIDPATLPTGAKAAPTDAILLAKVGGAAPVLVDIEAHAVAESAIDPAQTIVIEPMRPLDPKSEYALVLTQRLKDAEGGCVAPSQVTKDLLDGKASDAALTRIQPRVAAAVDGLVKLGALRAKEDASAAVVFTTQQTIEASLAIARDIRAKTVTYEAGTCAPSGTTRRCEGRIVAGNYRAGGHIDESAPKVESTYKVPVTTWLPATGAATKTLLFAHGLGGDRKQIAPAANDLTAAGYAVVAIDAPKHGQHPDKAGTIGVVEFFGASVISFLPLQIAIDSRTFRDNLRQATYDKLQLLQLLKAGLDVDGDQAADVTADKLAYVGLSLGGIMGPEFLAYAPETKAAVLMVPGARLTDVLRDSQNFQQAVTQFRGAATDGDLARVFPMMQAAIERGDPATSAPHVLTNRLEGFGGSAPQVLQQMVIDDDVVPNPSNRFFARALGLPLLGDELQAMGTARVETLPARDTIAAGITAGVFQFDVIEGNQKAMHNNIAGSDVAWAQLTPFLESSFAGAAEIRDPYRDLQVK